MGGSGRPTQVAKCLLKKQDFTVLQCRIVARTCCTRSAAFRPCTPLGVRRGRCGGATAEVRTADRSRSASFRCAYAHLSRKNEDLEPQGATTLRYARGFKPDCAIPDEKPRPLSSRSALLALETRRIKCRLPVNKVRPPLSYPCCILTNKLPRPLRLFGRLAPVVHLEGWKLSYTDL